MRDRKPKPQNTEFRFSKEVRGKAKINDNPIVADLDMLQKKHSNVLKTKGAVARLILAIKDDPTHFLDGSNPQNALLLKKLKDGKTGMIGVRREDTPENLIVHALKSSNKKEIERLVRRQMGRASLPTTLKNETGTGAKAHSSAYGDIISQNSAKGEAAEQGSKLERAEAKQEGVEGEGWTMRDSGAAKTGRAIKDVAKKQENNTIKKGQAPGQHPGANFANEKIINQPGLRLNKSREKLIKNTDVSKLNDEQKSVYDVFIGERDKVILQGKDLSDLYALEQGGKNAGAKKIMIKHAGIEKTGGLSNDELLNIMDVVRNGEIADDSFELRDDIIRYAYDLKKEDINFRVVIDEFNDGKKIFDYYSDRNFIDYGTTQKRLTGDKKFQSAPMAKDSQGLAFSPYKDDAQRVAQTNNDIILQNSAKGEAAEQGSKLEQAEAKQEVVKGEGWTMKDGTVAKQYAEHKFEPEKWINDLSGVLSDEWIANLKSLALKHPEMFKSEADVFRVIKEIKDNPTHFFKNNNDRNALLVKNLKEGKSGEIAVRKTDGQIVHATINNEKRLDRLQKRNKENLGNGELSKVEYSDGARRLPRHSDQSRTMPTAKAESAADDAGIIQTFARPGSKLENRGLGYQDEAIISQNSAKEELNALSKSYDVEQFLKDRENILAKDTRYGKTRFSDARVEDNGGVGGWEYKRAPAGYDKNYKADFLITKADVAKIRGGKINDEILTKLKQDLESSEHLGYEYKKTHKNNGADEYADEEFFKGAPVESKGGHSAAATIEEQRFANTGRDKNTIMYVNPHVGAGLAGGTLNAKDENGNFDVEKFAKGFIYGLFGSKVTAATLKKTNPKLYDQIVNIGKDKAGKEKISGFVNKLKQDELGKLLQKTITNKDLSTKTKIEIIEAAKKRFAKETPKSLNGQSEAQMISKG